MIILFVLYFAIISTVDYILVTSKLVLLQISIIYIVLALSESKVVAYKHCHKHIDLSELTIIPDSLNDVQRAFSEILAEYGILFINHLSIKAKS